MVIWIAAGVLLWLGVLFFTWALCSMAALGDRDD